MAGSNDTTVRFKADISQLKAQMQAAERQIKLVNSEFKAAAAGMDDWTKSADGLSAKTKQLAGVLDAQNKKLELMEKELEATVKAYGENSAAADRVRIKINEQKAAIANTESQLKTYEQKLSDLADGMDEAADGSKEFISASDKLKGTISEQEDKLESLKKRYSDLVLEGKQLSDEAEDTAREIKELSGELQENKSKLEEADKAADEFDDSLTEMDDAADKAADGFSVMKGALADLVADGIRATISAVKDLAKETFQVGSNFEAAMSQVAAVSGASGDDLDALTAKAEEMGAKTKFSATESAEAFNYMAMAGWKTEDMLGGIEGIMNLAAASGADLATTSDIVTDALTAMGYQAKDAGHLADVMAAASSNANTNVEMMGLTFQYAAPLAGALGYNMEDTALAIGLMANSGIKADKAGTALRGVLSRLAAPPKECAAAMEDLGISLTDDEGNMKSLSEVMRSLRRAFEGLSEEEQAHRAKQIAGQNAMSGLLAIVNATTEDYEKLSEAVYESEGAAQAMADTMNDNVSGALTLMKSKIEGIMIKLFNRAKDSMRDGIETFGNALDKIDWDKVGDAIGDIAKKAADFFLYVVNNSDRLISIIKTIGSVMAVVFVSNKITSVTTAISGFICVLTSAKSATEGLSAVTKLLGVNMAALPVMLVAGGLLAVYEITKKQKEANQEAAESLYGLTDAQKELIDTIDESTEASKRAKDARKETGETIDIESDRIKGLKDEYNSLIDENGKVKEGYEDFASYLLEELAISLDTTVENIKENIDVNGKLSKSIDELIEKKKLEAKLSAYDTDYTEALKNELKYFQELKGAKQEQTTAQGKLNEAQAEYNKALDAWNNNMNGFAKSKLSGELDAARVKLEEAQKTFDTVSGKVTEAGNNWANAQSTIEYYQDAMSASTEGNAQKMNDALLSMQYGLANHTTASKKELDQQFINTQKDLQDIQELYKQGHVSEELVNDYKRVTQLAGAELDKWVAKNGQAATDSANALNNNLNAALPRVTVTSGSLGMGSQLALLDGLGDWGSIGNNEAGDYIGAIDGKAADANKSAAGMGQQAANGLESKKANFKTAATGSANEFISTLNSFDGAARAAGEQEGGAAAEGADSKKGEFTNAANNSANEYVNTIRSHEGEFKTTGATSADVTANAAAGEVGEFKKAAEKSADQFVITIDSNSGKFTVTGKQMATTAAEGAESEAPKMQTPAEKAVQEFAGYIENNKSRGYDAAASLAGEAVSGADSKAADAETSGVNFAQGFINGIGSLIEAAKNKARELAGGALGALSAEQQEGSPSKITTQSGVYFGEGYINGIKKTTKDAIIAAADLGRDAIQSLRKAQQEGSPSKLTYKSGQNFTKGFINGIASLESALVATSKNMIKVALSSLLSLDNYNFSDVAASASSKFSSALTKKMQYTSGYMQYKNEQMAADFDKTIANIQKKSDKEVAKAQKASDKKQAALQKASNKKQNEIQKKIDKIKEVTASKRTSEQKKELKTLEKQLKAEQAAVKKSIEKQQKTLDKSTAKIQDKYNKQITTQQNMKDSYQRASSAMMTEFTAAMNEYQTAAQNLIDSTMEGITTKYEARYDELIGKQNNLIAKLKEAGDLFSLSNANLLTTNDIKAQTQQINRYAEKLKKVKSKVSNDLFEQIAGYDMKEGEAFVDRLLAMSQAELNAYNAAYTEKLNAADKLAQEIYKNDFDKIAADYDKEVKSAFSGLEGQLEQIGAQCLQGFVDGLTTNTDYMSDSIKTFTKGMIDTFKKQLGIKSPSRVTKKLGAYTAEGFAIGIEANTNMVSDAVEKMTASIENSFDFSRLSLIDGFTDAITTFEQEAKTVLTDSVSKIGSTYQTKFNEILNKQDNFAKKLKSTGELFTLSSANVMKVTDLNAQIKDLQNYSASLNKIKGKVSSQLFEQITTYNMEEGQAFIERLLSMSNAELKAYSNAYDKKLSLSEQLSQSLYKNDLDKVAGEYDKAIENAFKNLPNSLKAIGAQTMQGFLVGLGGNSALVNDSVQSIVNGMINSFKSALGIHSPSKVMEQIGEYTGEGFTDGLMSVIQAVKDAAQEISDTVASSLDWQGDISGARGTLKEAAGATGVNRNAGAFAGANTQIINFNQTNNSPKALDRLTLYRQTNNMLFNAKVRLSDV